MGTRAPGSDKQHHWQLQLSAWKTEKVILCHSCWESSIMQLGCIQSWILVKPELSSYRYQSSNQQYIRIREEFRINLSDKGTLRSSKQRPANQGSNASHLITMSPPLHLSQLSPLQRVQMTKQGHANTRKTWFSAVIKFPRFLYFNN